MIKEKNVLERFFRYVQIDSETGNESSFSEVLVEELKEMGFEILQDQAGKIIDSNANNIIAKRKGNTEKSVLLFSAHMDTVVPGKGIKPIIEDGVIRSQGETILGGDDKAGVAAIMEAVQEIVKQGDSHCTFEIVFTIAEEGGLRGSRNMDYSLIEAKQGIVLDAGGPPGDIIVEGPAQEKLAVDIFGKAAHAGMEPEKGISAINVASNAISRMKLLRVDEKTTANIGSIQGGDATNIVCPHVKMVAEARSLSLESLEKQTAHMKETFEKTAEEMGAKAQVEVSRTYDSYCISDKAPILKMVKKAMDNLGVNTALKTSGGGSDTNNYNAKGIQAVNLGVGMTKVHTTEESLAVCDLVKTTEIVEEIIKVASKE